MVVGSGEPQDKAWFSAVAVTLCGLAPLSALEPNCDARLSSDSDILTKQEMRRSSACEACI